MVKLNLDYGTMDAELNGKMNQICNNLNYDILFIHSFTYLTGDGILSWCKFKVNNIS